MSNEAYRKCKSCRFCSHKDDLWVCVLTSKSMGPDDTCERYRPGCCEYCNLFSKGRCIRTGETMYELDVCVNYDPSGSL